MTVNRGDARLSGMRHRLLPPGRQVWPAISLFCALLFAADLWIVVSGRYATEDASLGRSTREAVVNAGPGLTQLIDVVGRIGNQPERPVLAFCGILLAGLVLLRRWRSSVLVVGTIAGGALLEVAIRSMIVRPEPHLYGEHSFPSGHTTLALLVMGPVTYLSWHLTRRRSVAFITGLFFAVLAVLVGVERLTKYDAGVHYFSDVLGGYALGGMWCAAALALLGPWVLRERTHFGAGKSDPSAILERHGRLAPNGSKRARTQLATGPVPHSKPAGAAAQPPGNGDT